MLDWQELRSMKGKSSISCVGKLNNETEVQWEERERNLLKFTLSLWLKTDVRFFPINIIQSQI